MKTKAAESEKKEKVFLWAFIYLLSFLHSIPESVNRCLLIDTKLKVNSTYDIYILCDYKAGLSCQLCGQILENNGVENLSVHPREWIKVLVVSCLNRQSVGIRCHPAVRDTVCPALVSVPDGSSEFKVLIQQRLTHVFSFHIVGKFCLHCNQWELCQYLAKTQGLGFHLEVRGITFKV